MPTRAARVPQTRQPGGRQTPRWDPKLPVGARGRPAEPRRRHLLRLLHCVSSRVARVTARSAAPREHCTPRAGKHPPTVAKPKRSVALRAPWRPVARAGRRARGRLPCQPLERRDAPARRGAAAATAARDARHASVCAARRILFGGGGGGGGRRGLRHARGSGCGRSYIQTKKGSQAGEAEGGGRRRGAARWRPPAPGGVYCVYACGGISGAEPDPRGTHRRMLVQ